MQRTVSVPFDGIIASVPEGIESGTKVKKGELIAQLDTTELKLQRLEARNEQTEASKRADAALSQGKLDEYKQAQARADAAAAKIGLYNHLIEKASIRAPIAGTILEGDLTDMIGSSVKLGQAMYLIAPIDKLVVVAKVSNKDIEMLHDAVENITTGDVATKAFPGQHFPVVVERIVPLASPDADRRNAYEVRVRLERTGGWMRPGMEGLVKLNTGKRSLIDIGTRRIRDTLRLWLWW